MVLDRMRIPAMLLKKLYTFGSLTNTDEGFQFSVKNRLTDTVIHSVKSIRVDGQVLAHSQLILVYTDGTRQPANSISDKAPIDFPLKQILTLQVMGAPLTPGKHKLEIAFVVDKFGELAFTVEDALKDTAAVARSRIPRDLSDDYAEAAVQDRQRFVEEFSGIKLEHINKPSFDPHITGGNIENFTGVAQIPLGLAGPIKINGEYAQGEFLVPLATTEGTLVASYNRGIKVLNLSGGVRTTVSGDAMQRAPVFVFNNAREARQFIRWVHENIDEIRQVAESTSSVVRLQYIDPYLASKFAYLRFNFYTGDAAGQNMVGRATFAACNWIIDRYVEHGIEHFYLESNFATDKKASQVNILHTRGKRVTAEAIIKREVLRDNMRVEPEALHYHANVATAGAFMSGANNNGAHAANAITALFIATGQDVANVSESSAGILFTEINTSGDLYVSITLPSLIVATYGGGTGLATQRECLEIMGCYGKGKVNKLAEIIGGVVLAGELSLGAAISSADWVSSHEKYGRNR